MNRKPILQQYYTRGRQGIFRSNEGYDTIAKSAGLDNSFVKKTLHPFCVYDAPRCLQERGESDLTLYPEALVSFRAESGELVIGRSVFVGADFTGQRNTFFSHNYIIPEERHDDFMKEPAKIFGMHAFVSVHDETSGKELPALNDLPYHAGVSKDQKQWLHRIGIDERIFKQLLYAVMSSLSSKRKVYISLDGEVGAAAADARRLLEVLYRCLPYEMRRHFGFLTYSNEPQSKKHIHVMFVVKGSIRPGTGITEKDYLFDLAHQRIHQVDWQEGAHAYLDFAWEHLNEPRALASFHEFCEEVLAGADSGHLLRLATYHELCALYLMEKGRLGTYEQNPAGMWQVLQHYLGQDRLESKTRLLNLRDALFREEAEALKSKRLPDRETVSHMLKAYSAIPKERTSTELIAFMMNVLLQGKTARKHDYVADIYQQLSGCRELFGFLMRSVLGYKEVVKPLFEDYLAQRLASFSQIDQVLQEIEFWAETAPTALRNPYFMTAVREKVISLFGRDQQKLQTALTIHDFLERQDQMGGFADELLDELDKSLLKLIALDSLSWDDFGKIMTLLEEKPQTFFGELDLESRQKLEHISQLSSLAGNREAPLPEVFFRKWDGKEMALLQQLIANLLKRPLMPESYPLVALVYYQTDLQGQDSFAYSDMLRFVFDNGGEEVLFSFIQWSMTERMFFTGKSISPGYRQAIKRILLENRGRRLREKEWKKRWHSVRHADFRKLLEEVRSETANPLMKLFQRKSTALFSVIVLLASGAAASFLLFMPDAVPATPDAPVTPPGGQTAEQPRVTEEVEFVPVYQLMMEPQIRPVSRTHEF
ncbi:hypothetical protein [Brevibacillus choshinensis]|uniref:Glycosyltransferase n=1 Tax=Brevibacillus choshinensis TaxID=54911 RepID=A0ABX7FPH3_BRECH|nr:hypothetical protein [Brevibacillus choshinensis]QRG67595.1 hypothetical protein JNE38_29930 [Brevibacillus choshinensis]